MSLWEIYKAKRLGYADDLWTSLIGKTLGGYSWLSDYETTPYLYRAMPNMSHYYNREIMEEVVGGSVGWNQLCNGSSVTVQSGHKYFLKKGSAESVATSAGSAITGLTSGSDIVVDLTLALGSTIADYVYSLEQATVGSGVAWLKENFPKMFQYNPYDAGSIQSVSGLVSHDTVGFNQWDEEWEVGLINADGTSSPTGNRTVSKNHIPVVAGTTYYMSWNGDGSVGRGAFYDADFNCISSYLDFPLNTQLIEGSRYGSIITIPSGASYMKFCMSTSYGDTYNNDICINLSDASRNGQYEPYRKSSYPLDSTLTLRGIPKLDNGKLYYDGDVYEPDGSVSRKYGVVDLGTLEWYLGDYGQMIGSLPENIKAPTTASEQSEVPNCICARLAVVAYADRGVATEGNARLSVAPTSLDVRGHGYSDASAFKSAMQGVYLVYELATPTTETAQPFTKTQLCDSGGTEEFVTSGIVSVGHKSKYAEK